MLGTKYMRAAALALAAMLALGACGGDDDDASDDAATDATDVGGSDEGDAGDTDDDELVDPPAGGSTNAEPVDVCSLITAADISEALDTEFAEGTAGTPSGSLLGQCDFSPVDVTTADVVLVSISARPAAEYDATVEASGNATSLDGFSVDANQTDAGVMLRYPDFMIVVLAAGGGGLDADAAVAAAQAFDEAQG